ncbi:glutathione S-transferase family protein [Rhizorhabdus wittichii]|uniref:glutathione S-transferase family protein n=1 Tax=Rhizorhabdus wittichii TaxID=160791 RepID=UPI0002D37870|nr:glutathione S-transferase family protein [Rhizorhabdus wittichii]
MKLYFCPRPNPLKVALYLEEAGIAHEIVPVDLLRGAHQVPEFTALNPNAKVPVLVDGDAVVFDSSAILLHLVERTGLFGPGDDGVRKGEFLSWMLFIASGLAPFSGQAVHFRHHAPEPQPYAANRYAFEADRHWSIIEARLAERRYLLGADYTALDMSLWGWAPALPYLLGEDAWDRAPNIRRWLDEVEARPAVARVRRLEMLYPYKTDIDDETRRIMFPQNVARDGRAR